MKAKYVVKKKTRTNNAFDAYKNIALNQPVTEPSAPPPRRAQEEKKDAPKVNLPYQREALAIADIYQAESSNEAEGENILRVELTNGTYRDFVVKNGPKGDPGMTGLGGIRGPRGAQGSQGPKGEKGDKGDRGEPGPQGPMAKEELITIADITTTEELAVIEIGKDLEGKNFSCKKVKFVITLPNNLETAIPFLGFYLSNSNWNKQFHFEIPTGCKVFNGKVEVDEGKTCDISYVALREGGWANAWNTIYNSRSILDSLNETDCIPVTKIVWKSSSGDMPAGTKIKICGLKA